MNNFKKFLISIFFLTFIVSIQAGEKVKNDKLVAVILPFTSAFAGIANEQKEAIELAMQNYPGYDVFFKDSKSDAAGAVVAFKELMNLEKPPFAVISCASWVATALHPLAAEADIFHIVIASASFSRTVPKHTVRFTLDASMEEKQLANYLSKFQRIAIYHMDNSYGNGWKKTIETNFGDKIVKAIAYNPQHKDFKNDLLEIKKPNPDALVLLSAGNGALIAKQAREIGITAQFVGTRPIERPDLLVEAKYTNGLVFTYPTYDIHNPMIATFAKAYGSDPTIFGVEAFAAFTSLIISAQEGNLTTSSLFDWYAGSAYIGVLGQVHFDEKGDAQYPYMYKAIANGKFITAPFQYKLLLENAAQEIEKAFQQKNLKVEDIINEPDLIHQIISRKVSNFPIEMWIMQEDGKIIYDDNKFEIGKNILKDEFYSAYPAFVKVAETIATNSNGSGEYVFADDKSKVSVSRKVVWTTITLQDKDFRLALSHIKTGS